MKRIKDALIGSAIGDALGVPVEFTDRSRLINQNITTMLGNMSHNVEKGTWSDDTSMVLATMDSIINKRKVDYNDIMNNFLLWIKEGKYTPDNKAFGVGKITLQAIGNYTRGSKPIDSGLGSFKSNGNGSLMRILPIAFYCYNSNLKKEEIYFLVKEISSLTHKHEISYLGAYIYTLYIINLLNGKDKEDAYCNIKEESYEMFNVQTLKYYKRIIKNNVENLMLAQIKSTAYVVDTLESVFWVFLNSESYDEAVLKAIHLGNDTDTIAALVGALGGIYYGYNSINKDWLKNLRYLTCLEKVSEQFSEIKIG
jgi:ADP-ribosylglycohydrolase